MIGIGEIDVRKKESLQAAVNRCVSELGGIDILMCVRVQRFLATDIGDNRNAKSFYSAGAAGNFLAPLTQLSENAFRSVIEIDLLGSYNTVKAAFPALITSAEKAKKTGSPGKHRPH